jgi:hypothetical protein
LIRHVCALSLLVAVGLRSAELAAVPAFTPAIEVPLPMSMRLEGLRAAMDPQQSILLEARACYPGRERLGPLWLGFATHMDLQQVRLSCTGQGQPISHAQAGQGRWDGEELILTERVVCEGPDGPFAAERVTLRRGIVTVHR